MPKPSPEVTADAVWFAAVPYIRVYRPIALGEYVLWRNEPKEWTERIGADGTPFVEMYRDRRGNAVGASGSILTRNNGQELQTDDLWYVIPAYSSIMWLSDRPSADAWLFEVWRARTPLDFSRPASFVRTGKFSRNATNSAAERIHPSPYTYGAEVYATIPDEILRYLTRSVTEGPARSSVLTALHHFHRARFETPYFGSAYDDAETLWSGFESLFAVPPVPREHPASKAGRLASLVTAIGEQVSRVLPRVGAALRALAREPKPERVSRAEWLATQVVDELTPLGLHVDAARGIREWAHRLYDIRNWHSHGLRAEPISRELEAYGRDVIEVGIEIARHLVRLRAFEGNIFFASETIEAVNTTFRERAVVKAAVDALTSKSRDRWYPGAEGDPSGQADLAMLREQLLDLTQLGEGSTRFRDDPKVARARQTIGLILSAWTGDAKGGGVPVPPCIADVPEAIGAALNEAKQRGLKGAESRDAVDASLANVLEGAGAHLPENYAAHQGRGDSVGGVVPVWLLAKAFIKLTSLYRGY